MASGSVDKTIRMWDIKKQKEVGIFYARGPIYSVQFSPDGKLLALGSGDTSISLWDVEEEEEVGVKLE